MFNERAFRTWGHVLIGACVVSGLFLGIMLMAEKVIGGRIHVSRAVVAVTTAAFVGYLGTAWLVRLEGSSGP